MGLAASFVSEDTLITFSIHLWLGLNGEKKKYPIGNWGGWAHVSGRENTSYHSCSACLSETEITISWAY